ncbi:MAG: hypothetical protein RL141_1096 [Candidatus Parcubacteria bacterium]|jgi:hypothetical protein
MKPNRLTVPPGLVMVADLIARIPERAQEVIASELAKREREQTVAHETRNLLSWHPINTTRMVLLFGFHGFVLAWALGWLGAIGQAYAHLKVTTIAVPLPLVQDLSFNLGTLVPTSTVLSVASHLPTLDFRDALGIGIGIAIVVALERGIIAAFQWKKSRLLRAAEMELEKEMELLRGWQEVPRKP